VESKDAGAHYKRENDVSLRIIIVKIKISILEAKKYEKIFKIHPTE
jgi:hypothetical protein